MRNQELTFTFVFLIMDRDHNNHPGHQNSGFSSVVFRDSIIQNARDCFEKKGFAENCHFKVLKGN